MSGLTPKQAKVLAYIQRFTLQEGWSPSLDEIAVALGYKSRSTPHRTVKQLVDRGAITLRKGHARSIAIARGLHVVTVDLPPEIDFQVSALAERSGTTREAVVIEALRDRLSALRSKNVSRETQVPPKPDRVAPASRSLLG